MKSSISLARHAAALAAAALILALSGCGQKGPLYMPVVPPDPFAVPTAKAPAPKRGETESGMSKAGVSSSQPADASATAK